MSDNLSLVRGIIRKSLEESRKAQCSSDLCRQRAIYHALKAMYLLIKDQPRSVHIEIIGAEKSSNLHDHIEVTQQPEYKDFMRVLPDMVRDVDEEMSHV